MTKKGIKQKNLMLLKIPLTEAEKILQKQIDKGKTILEGQIKNVPSLRTAEKLYNHWNSENYDILKKVFRFADIARDYSTSIWSIGGILISDLKVPEKVEKLHGNIHFKISKLDSILHSIRLVSETKEASADRGKVFFIHGTDCHTSSLVLSFIRALGLQPIIMKELAHAGKTIITEIRKRAEVKYAICLLTPDNLGGVSAHELHFRADQNVILELGIFVGRLGRENVSSLFVEGVELPEDFHAFEHIEIDRTNEWKEALLKELTQAGFEIKT